MQSLDITGASADEVLPGLGQDDGVSRWRCLPVVGLITTLAISCGEDDPSASERADTELYQQMLREPAGGLHPPGAVRVHGLEIPPCQGDSGSGPLVIRGYGWSGAPDDLFAFSRSELERMGWQSLNRELRRSAGGDFEELTATKMFAGYPVAVSVRTVKFDRQDFDLILSAVPRQDCYD